MKRTRATRERGVTVVEIAIGVSIAALIIVFSGNAIAQFINAGRAVNDKTQALYLAEEGLEMIRLLRDDAWGTISGLPIETTRYLSVAPGAITITTTPEVIEGFTRGFSVQNVYRNATTDDVVASTTSGSVADTHTKYVTVTVTGGTPTQTVSLTSIIADIDP